jgi:hypothetical protein
MSSASPDIALSEAEIDHSEAEIEPIMSCFAGTCGRKWQMPRAYRFLAKLLISREKQAAFWLTPIRFPLI